MFRFRKHALAALLALALLSAAPLPSPDELIRQGNAAVERGEFGDALLSYQQAEERGSDPGLIAFNKANAYYQLSDYRRAENHFRMALDDAAISPERRPRALYNLGNCLVQQAGEKDLRMLRDAIRCYELCLEAVADTGLRSDAVHNLELAKLLWNKARAKSAKPPDPNSDEPPDTPPKTPEPKKKDTEPKNVSDPGKDKGGKEMKADFDPKAKIDPSGKADAKGTKGNAPPDHGPPVPPDTSEVQKQSPDDTVKALKNIEDRLHDERVRLRREAAIPENSSGMDW
jgi:tetratricopeptide (TPR) repeat protein